MLLSAFLDQPQLQIQQIQFNKSNKSSCLAGDRIQLVFPSSRKAQIRLIVHFSCCIYFPVADMEAGLPDVTGNDSGGVFTGLAPLSTR